MSARLSMDPGISVAKNHSNRGIGPDVVQAAGGSSYRLFQSCIIISEQC